MNNRSRLAKTTTDDDGTVERVRQILQQQRLSLTLAIPSYGEGDGIIVTLASVWDGLTRLGQSSAPIFLSDSSPDRSTVEAASRWARLAGAQLKVNHSDRRRSLKEALNVALAAADTDLLIVVVADVVVPAESLAHLIEPLCTSQPSDVVVGLAAADPSSRGLRYGAGRFQLNVIKRLVQSGDGSIRAEGAFWACNKSFYRSWRFPIGSGSVADDVELARSLEAGNYRGSTAPHALVYKIPPGTIRDFCLQTRRSYFAIGAKATKPLRRGRESWVALANESRHDPLGSACYIIYRVIAAVTSRWYVKATHTETWEPSHSTKRNSI